MFKTAIMYLKLSIVLSALITLLITISGCSDFGQPMGIPNKSKPQTETTDEYSVVDATASETAAKSGFDSSSGTSQDSESTTTEPQTGAQTGAKVIAPPTRKTILKREIPWVELAALNQGVALSADGEVDTKQMTKGCNSLASHEAEIKKQVQYITDYSLEAAEQAAGVRVLLNYPHKQNFPAIVLNRLNAGGVNQNPSLSMGIDCKMQQTASVLGSVSFTSFSDKNPTREITIIENTKSMMPAEQTSWAQKSIELKRVFKSTDLKSDLLFFGIAETNHSGHVSNETYHAQIKLVSKKSQDDGTILNVYKFIINKFVLSETSVGNQLDAEVLHESKEVREFNIEVQETMDGKQKLVRFHRPLEPLPQPWLQNEDGILRSLVNITAYFDAI